MQQMWSIIANITLLAALLWLAIEDIRKKMIHCFWLIPAAVFGVASKLFSGEPLIPYFIGVLLLTCFLYGLSRLTRGGIGEGDIFVALAFALVLGGIGAALVITAGLILSAVAAGVLFILKKAGRKDTIPLVPFLCVSYGGVLLWLHFG